MYLQNFPQLANMYRAYLPFCRGDQSVNILRETGGGPDPPLSRGPSRNTTFLEDLKSLLTTLEGSENRFSLAWLLFRGSGDPRKCQKMTKNCK